ncbi:nucleotidyltransferase family protein [Odoribacter laneus]|uniref:nucleotidyltransferase family protein n=1 Tax=Odoribacter laneus TaxID=626933 RepID=UPI003AF5CF3E
MDYKYLERIIDCNQTIIQALKKMDEKRVKSLLVVEQGHFLSMLTIGDIQRAIINKVDLNRKIDKIINSNKEYASTAEDVNTIKEKMLVMRAECMPVLDEKGEMVKVYFWEDFFSDKAKEEFKEKINLPVVIMAGGQGTRLRPLTNVIPKPLIPISEKTILEVIMDQFEGIGCKKFYISVNYKAEILEYYFNHLEHKYDIEFFREEKPLGTIGSVSLLKNKINTPFFVSNCDNLIDQDFRDVYEYHQNNENDITIITSVKSYQIPYGVIETGSSGLLTNLTEKPEMTYMINTGVYILQPELINEIPSNHFFHITDLIIRLREKNGKIGCFPVSEKSWTDIGDWTEYNKILCKY